MNYANCERREWHIRARTMPLMAKNARGDDTNLVLWEESLHFAPKLH